MDLTENKINDELLRCNVCNVNIDFLKVKEHADTVNHRKNKAKYSNELSFYLNKNNGSDSTIGFWLNSISQSMIKNNDLKIIKQDI